MLLIADYLQLVKLYQPQQHFTYDFKTCLQATHVIGGGRGGHDQGSSAAQGYGSGLKDD